MLGNHRHQHREHDKNTLFSLIFKHHDKKIRQCHMKYQGDHGDLYVLIPLPFISTLSLYCRLLQKNTNHKHMEGFITDNLLKKCKIVFLECKLPVK